MKIHIRLEKNITIFFLLPYSASWFTSAALVHCTPSLSYNCSQPSEVSNTMPFQGYILRLKVVERGGGLVTKFISE